MYSNGTDLDNMNIHSLRLLGRQLGVQSPTMLKQAELKKSIVDILNGIETPYNSKRGRPPKDSLSSVTCVGGSFFYPEMAEINDDPIANTYLRQHIDDYDTTNSFNIYGYVEVLPNGTKLIKNSLYHIKEITIIDQRVESYDYLHTGDRVMAEAQNIGIRCRLAYKLGMVNGMRPIDYITLPDFDSEASAGRGVVLPISKQADELAQVFSHTPLHYGDRMTILADDMRNLTLALQTIAMRITAIDNTVIMYINPQITERELEFCNMKNGVEKFVCRMNSSANEQSRMLTLCRERAKRIAERGGNVIMVIDNATILSSIYDSDETVGAKALYALCKNSNKGSISMISGLMNECISAVETNVYRVYTSADTILTIMPKEEYGIRYIIDTTKTIINTI